MSNRGLNILCIDNGGVRGLSALIILQEIMRLVANAKGEERIHPHEHFDFIAGTGTGGISACMLGRLRLPIDRAIEEYAKLVQEVFADKKLKGPTMYKATRLQEGLKTIIRNATGNEDERMIEGGDNNECKTAVFAMTMHNLNAGLPVMFRSYTVYTNSGPDCSIRDALHATMAHPELFRSNEIISSGISQIFIGGELGCNNPIAHVLSEIKRIYPDRQIASITSIGAGHARTIRVPAQSRWSRTQDIIVMKHMATDSERVAEEMEIRFQDTSNVYFRFNVDQGMQDMKGGSWERLGEATQHTKAYLLKGKIDQKLGAVVRASMERHGVLSTAQAAGQISRVMDITKKPTSSKRCPAPTKFYTGYQDERTQVAGCITQGKGELRVCVVYGLGGVGKSQLVLNVIEHTWDQWSYIIYVDASSSEAIEKGLNEFAASQNIGQTYKDTINWLESCGERWLVAFDNADNPLTDVRQYIPTRGRGGSMVITTRLPDMASLAIGPSSVCFLSSMSQANGVALLDKIASLGNDYLPDDDIKASEELVKDFGCLPLAITHAGAYIAHIPGMTIAKYRSLFLSNRQRMLEQYNELPATAKIDYSGTTVYTTWRVCYDQLKPESRQLLSIIAYLYNNGISEIFKRAAQNMHSKTYPLPLTDMESQAQNYVKQYLSTFLDSDGHWDAIKFLMVAADLAAYSLIKFERMNGAYSIHVLVQDWAKTMTFQELAVECTAALLVLAIDEMDVGSLVFNLQLQLHITSTLKHKPSTGVVRRILESVENIGLPSAVVSEPEANTSQFHDKSKLLGLQDWGSSIPGPSMHGGFSGRGGTEQGKGSGDKRPQNTPKQTVAPVSQPPRMKRGINILCIDGGGVCGLSSLLLLREAMNRLQNQGEMVKPMDWFDVVAGTGTGGVIACMLGKLGMSIEEAIQSYVILTEATFSSKKKSGITGGPAYKSTILKDSLRSIIQAATGDGDKKMSEGTPKLDGCNTLIFAALKDNMNASIPVIFRSYQVAANRALDCATWEAAYATMAHPDFFKSIVITDGLLEYSFVGGELGNSNPLAHVLTEVRDLYPGEYVSCIMSIGAGHAHTIQITNTSRQQASFAMRAMATDSERVAEEMARRFQDTTGVYFRFNVDQGTQDVESDDWEKLSTVGAHTQAYLNKSEVDRRMREATKAIRDRNNALAVAWIDGRAQRMLETASIEKCPAPTAYYTGRTKEIQGVGSCIVNGGYQQQVCVIYGLGGAGKSQLAFKAIEQNYHRWNHIIYVDATSKETIERALGDYARVNLKYLGDTHRITYADTLLWLQGTPDSWLLFFDGADDLHLDIHPYFPSYRGSILVTTRLEARAGLANPPEAVYHVSGMDPEDASSLLFRIVNRRAPSRAQTTANKIAASALVYDFGFLALAIVHAGAYIAHSAGLSITEYHHQFREKKREMLEKHSGLPQASKVSNYKDTVYTTWNMCYELLGEHGKQGTQELLWLIAFLQHDGITKTMFQRAATKISLYVPVIPAANLEQHAYDYLHGYLTQSTRHQNSEHEGNWMENSFVEIMGDLAAYSLIEYDEVNEAYTIHVLVQDWARTVVPHKLDTSLERTAALLATSMGLQYNSDPDSHHFRVRIAPHVRKILSESRKPLDYWEVNPNHAVCFANVFRSMKLWREEENLRIKIAEARRKLLGLEHPATLQGVDDLAQNYLSQGQSDKAEILHSEVLEARRKLYGATHGEEHHDILQSKKYLASVYQSQSRFNEALPFWEDTVRYYRILKGGNNSETLACMDSLADVYRRLMKMEKAEELRKDMIDLMRDDNPHKPTCIKKLAEVLESKEEWDTAELQLVRYQEALNKLWGVKHANATIDQHCIYELRIRRESVPPVSCASCMHPADVASICPKSKYICDFAARAFRILPFSLAILVVAYLLPVCFGISS